MSYATIFPRTLCGAIAIVAISGTTFAAPQPASNLAPTVRWSNGIADQANLMTPAQLNNALTQLAHRKHSTRVLITLAAPISTNERAQLQTQGLTLLSSLGSTHYFATLAQNADTDALSNSSLASISAIKTHQKLHKDLLSGVIHPWAVSNQGAVAKSPLKDRVNTESILLDEYTRVGIDPTIAVIVKFHKDADYNANGARIARELGAQVVSEIYSVNAVVLHMPASRINDLATDDAVMWAEPPLPQMSELNAENRILTGVNTLQTAPYNLDGSGVTALIYDGGRMATHGDFGSRMTVGQSDTAGVSDHSTHVGGTVGGDGSSNINNRGMAPAVDLISYGFEQEGGLVEGFLYTDPGDLEADYTEAINLYGSDLSNNSIGTNTAPNGFPCDWTGNYGITSELIDSIAAGSLGSPFRIVWANGNERQTTSCTGDDSGNHGQFYSTAPPACAKNHIAVGSVDADTDLTSSFSSWGPTDDGRIKPDISAPGCQDGGDGGVTSTGSFSTYTVKCGTSMAAPTVAGVAALILQQYRDTFPDRDDLRNGTLKALLANTAVDRGNAGPDFQYGYGSIRAIDAVDTVIAENIIESEVAQSGTYQGIIIVGAGESELKVTIAWDDVPGTPNVSPSLVNDLDLRIIDSNGNPYLPWTLDPSNPNAAAVQSSADHLNNIEQVSILNPAPGAYTVEVTGFNIAQGPTQSFGVVSSSTLINCSSAGIISMGGNYFSCDGSTSVQVVDCDLNTSDLTIETVDIMISSDSDAGFMLTLTESAPESATFLGSFSFADTAGSDLLVSEADTLTAIYNDLDDGNGNFNQVTASATIDCTSPTISNAFASNVEARAATLNADFNEPSKATYHYGLSMAALNNTATAGAFATSHAVNISGLTDNTTYFFTVDAEDRAGNTSSDDNNGNGYTFTTPDIPDFFTEEFTGSGMDLEGLSLTLTPDGGPEGYVATIESLAGGILPFEPKNGTPISLSDDDSEPVTIAGGNSVQIYGQSFASFNVGSNGYITFGSADTDYTESLSDHFDTTRISGLFDDLNPSDSGTVYKQQLADRMVISYDRVTEFSGSNLNTFQIELHFDGTIIISWEQIDSGDAVIGISEGTGQDPDFIESDLSAYPAPSLDCPADMNGDGDLNFLDVSEFITLFGANDKDGDFNNDNLFNFLDVSAFLASYAAGCP